MSIFKSVFQKNNTKNNQKMEKSNHRDYSTPPTKQKQELTVGMLSANPRAQNQSKNQTNNPQKTNYYQTNPQQQTVYYHNPVAHNSQEQTEKWLQQNIVNSQIVQVSRPQPQQLMVPCTRQPNNINTSEYIYYVSSNLSELSNSSNCSRVSSYSNASVGMLPEMGTNGRINTKKVYENAKRRESKLKSSSMSSLGSGRSERSRKNTMSPTPNYSRIPRHPHSTMKPKKWWKQKNT